MDGAWHARGPITVARAVGIGKGEPDLQVAIHVMLLTRSCQTCQADCLTMQTLLQVALVPPMLSKLFNTVPVVHCMNSWWHALLEASM